MSILPNIKNYTVWDHKLSALYHVWQESQARMEKYFLDFASFSLDNVKMKAEKPGNAVFISISGLFNELLKVYFFLAVRLRTCFFFSTTALRLGR